MTSASLPVFDSTDIDPDQGSPSARLSRCWLAAFLAFSALASPLAAQSLEQQLNRTSAAELAALARQEGDAQRGAVVFFQQQMACSKCHAVGQAKTNSLGPDLTTLGKEATDESLVESVLLPSKIIRKGFESVTATMADGKALTALLVERTADRLVVRDLLRGELTTIPAADLEDVKANTTSVMPSGQVNQLNSRQQFLDLIRYLIEIRDGGQARAAQLQPSAALLTITVPEYEQHLDHAALIGAWDDSSLQRGEAIYQRVCANCHGTKEKLGSLPTSLRFAEGKFKNGSDPLSMYRTLTFGFGLMAPQSWMVPSQKYDVIHYLREKYLKPHNPTQFVSVDAAYLARLPQGDTRGPEPSKIEPWSAMDYGPTLTHTYEVPGWVHNFAYKGVAVRLDEGGGGISRGRHWMVFDTDTLRAAAGWSGSGDPSQNFIDWQGIQFNGEHGVHPHVIGPVAFSNSTGPGWSNPASGDFLDEQRVLGRDGRRYGPLPRAWAKYRGMYYHGQQVVFSYTVGTTDVLESPSLWSEGGSHRRTSFLRTFNIGPREQDLLLQVAEHPADNARPTVFTKWGEQVELGLPFGSKVPPAGDEPFAFDGNTYLELDSRWSKLDMVGQDFTIAAKVKTKTGGTICAIIESGAKWIPDGQTFFVRDGKLCFDIGWVGVIGGKSKVDDDQWHHVAVTREQSAGRLRLYVDGRLDGEGALSAKAVLPKRILRIGFTAPDFPRPASFFQGEIAEVRFYRQRLTEDSEELIQPATRHESLVARWVLAGATGRRISGDRHHLFDAQVIHGVESAALDFGDRGAGFGPARTPVKWTGGQGRLRLRIPAGKQPLRFTIWQPAKSQTIANFGNDQADQNLPEPPQPEWDRDLALLTHGGPPRWTQKLETQAVLGADNGPFAADVLTAPESNPWLAQTRFTGLDFLPDGRLAVCSWDGDVWLVEVSPAASAGQGTDAPQALRWQRIASGLFQPLGLKVVDGKIHVTCRDQLVVLHDLNGDGETDFYECLNNDHQVTEHFHEFAMGLQTDAAGNFYYAKSARHGLPAVVPHHGTLLRVSKDGAQTDILANGFRAANGVCLNADGSFVVTDQEGFWNPKNRINWVTANPSGKPKFYGNMLGYHDVTDASDSAMVPPLCWITNAFDRSPAELLWVDSGHWGPLQGSLLNLSYGYGKVFLVPHENVRGTMQGGMIELPAPAFPTGVMRGRFNPADGQLYLCGMFAWAGNATYPGGLYRLRATGQPMNLPVGLQATKAGIKLSFTEPLDPASLDVKSVQIKTWLLKRTANYGSEHFDEKQLDVRGAKWSADAKTVTLDIADLQPTWCMEIKYSLRSAAAAPVQGTIHNTIHELGD